MSYHKLGVAFVCARSCVARICANGKPMSAALVEERNGNCGYEEPRIMLIMMQLFGFS